MKHPIDDYFSKQLKDVEYKMDPADWEGARQLLQRRANRKRRGLIWLFAFFGFLLALTAGWLIMDSHKPDINSTTPPKQSVSESATALSPDVIQNHSEPLENQDADLPQSRAEKAASIAVVTDNMSRETPDENQDADLRRAGIKNAGTMPAFADGSIPDSPLNTDKVKTTDGTNKQPSDPNSPLSEVVPTKVENQAVVNQENEPGDNNREMAVMNRMISQTGRNTTDLRTSPAVPVPAPDESRILAVQPVRRFPLRPLDLALSAKRMPVVANLPERPIDVSPLRMSGLDFFISSRISPPISATTKTWRGLASGILYSRPVHRQWGLHLGLGILFQNGSFGIDDSAELIRSSGGATVLREVQENTPTGAFYVHIPVGVNWSAGRHTISTGVEINRLLKVRGRQVTSTYAQNLQAGLDLPSANADATRVSSVWLPDQSFNSWHWQSALTYQYRLSGTISLTTGINVLLNDMERADSDLMIKESSRFMGRAGVLLHLK